MSALEITEAELNEIEALGEAATKGPWAVRPMVNALGDPSDCVIAKGAGNVTVAAEIEETSADAAFIAASREAVPRLVAALREARALLEEASDPLARAGPMLRALASGASVRIDHRDENAEIARIDALDLANLAHKIDALLGSRDDAVKAWNTRADPVRAALAAVSGVLDDVLVSYPLNDGERAALRVVRDAAKEASRG